MSLDLTEGESYALIVTRRKDGTIVETYFPSVSLSASPEIIHGERFLDGYGNEIVDPDRIHHWKIDGIAHAHRGYSFAARILEEDQRRTLVDHLSWYRRFGTGVAGE